MAVPQRKFRELVFQMVFSQGLNLPCEAPTLFSLFDQFAIARSALKRASERAEQVFEQIKVIDCLIARFSLDYQFQRISLVERGILRLGVYELIYDTTLPPKVVFSEAVRLSRKFGTSEGGRFVNAVLDAIYRAEVDRVCPAV